MTALNGQLKRFGQVRNGTTPASGDPDYWGGDVLWATPEDLGKLPGTTIDDTRRTVTELAVSEVNLSRVPKGSLLLSTRAPIGHMGIAGKSMVFNQGCRSIVPGPKLDSHFCYYLLASRVDELNARANGTTFKELSRDQLAALPVSLPDLDTQRRIAGYLDDKTARIDALIEKKRALLDRLAEKRQALITRAVTRGLNTDAALKDSEIDWLGKVPAHWEVKPLRRFVSRIEQGWSPSADDRARLPEEWAVLKSGCVNGGTFDPNQYKVLPEDTDPLEELEVKDGDILMCRASGSLHYIGSVAMVHEPPARLIFSDKNYRITPDASVMDHAFFVYGMASKALRDQIVLSVSGAEGLANNIAQASVKEYLFAVPPISEQVAIAEYLSVALGKIENVAVRCEISIDKLTEYRAALVTAAVTGKINALWAKN